MSKFEVPFLSQHNNISSPNWKNQGCGIIALKMLLDFWHAQNSENKTESVEELIKNRSGAYIENIGWSHSGLVSIARQYGYDGFNKDLVLSKAETEYALEELKRDLTRFPIMVSVWSKFDPANKGGHLVVLTSIDDGHVYINDPEEQDEKLGRKSLTIEQFLKAFKKRYVAIYPANMISRLEKRQIFNVNVPKSYLAMIENSAGTKMFRNLYIKTPQGEKDVLNNGDRSCAVFVSSVLYYWGLISDTHANVAPTINDMLSYGWSLIDEPIKGCVIEWEPKEINGSTNKHLGFYLGDEQAISNRIENGAPTVHHWTYGTKDGQPVRKVEKIFWHKKLD